MRSLFYSVAADGHLDVCILTLSPLNTTYEHHYIETFKHVLITVLKTWFCITV